MLVYCFLFKQIDSRFIPPANYRGRNRGMRLRGGHAPPLLQSVVGRVWPFVGSGGVYLLAGYFREQQLEKARCENSVLETRRLAAELCSMHGYIKRVDSMDEDTVEGGDEPPLVEKSRDGMVPAVRLLIEARASLEVVNAAEQTPLHEASRSNNAEVACRWGARGLERGAQYAGSCCC